MVLIPKTPHAWRVSPARARAIQRELRSRVEIVRPAAVLRLIAGVDAAFSPDETLCLAAVVLWDADGQCVVEERTASRALTFPYIPGLLSFREAPAILAALRKLRREPDAIMCDGQGLAHPLRFGIACHIGVITGRPTLGCAKSLLVGDCAEPRAARGSRSALEDRGEVVGEALRTRAGVKPVYVSAGHRIDLETAVDAVLRCAVGFRLPEPTRLADRLVALAKRRREN